LDEYEDLQKQLTNVRKVDFCKILLVMRHGMQEAGSIQIGWPGKDWGNEM
jgi:hypothetical protein